MNLFSLGIPEGETDGICISFGSLFVSSERSYSIRFGGGALNIPTWRLIYIALAFLGVITSIYSFWGVSSLSYIFDSSTICLLLFSYVFMASILFNTAYSSASCLSKASIGSSPSFLTTGSLFIFIPPISLGWPVPGLLS